MIKQLYAAITYWTMSTSRWSVDITCKKRKKADNLRNNDLMLLRGFFNKEKKGLRI